MPRQSKRYGVRIVEPILEAMGIGYHNIEEQTRTWRKSARPSTRRSPTAKPVVLLIGQRPS